MSGVIDSQAVFKQKVTEVGLGHLWPAFETMGWTTYGRFAFAGGYQPGAGQSDKVFSMNVATRLVDSPDDTDIPLFRRPNLESFILSSANV